MATEHNRAFNAEIAPHIEGGASLLVQLAAPPAG
jgi:hypothetical protein